MTTRLYETNQAGVGFTFAQPVIYLEHWLNAWQGDKPLLDIGCGHGVNTLQALAHGAQVIATDLEPPALPEHQALTQTVARLPDHMPFADESFAGILCAEVFHFFTNEQVIPAIKELYRLLQPGGLLLVTCVSCDIDVLQSTGLEQRVKNAFRTTPNQLHGQEDYTALLHQAAIHYAKPEVTDAVVASHKATIPDKHFTFYIAEQLGQIIEREGFTIEICEQGPAPHYPVWSHGNQDQVRIFARKQGENIAFNSD